MNFIYISENLTVFLHRTDGCFFCCFKAFVTTKWPVLKHALKSTNAKLGDLRDPKDVPVLSDAIQYEVDVLVTGDKDFLEADIKRPIILSPAMMFEYLTQRSKHQ